MLLLCAALGLCVFERHSVGCDGTRSRRTGVRLQLPRQEETDCCVHISARYRLAAPVFEEAHAFGTQTVGQVIHKTVHNMHCSRASASAGPRVLKHTIQIGRKVGRVDVHLAFVLVDGHATGSFALCSVRLCGVHSQEKI